MIGTKQFTATVANTTNSALGTISTSGLYKAPNLAPLPLTVTVTAISKADPGKTASATVTLTRK